MINAIIGLATSFIKGRQEQKAKEHEARTAWETAVGRSMDNGWKDEYVTVIITLPILQSFVGNLWFALTGNSQILEAQSAFLADMSKLMDSEYGVLVWTVSLAAVGTKGLKTLK